MADRLEKKQRLAAEYGPPFPPDLDELDPLFFQRSDDLLRDDMLSNRASEFRAALDARFKGIDSEVYATEDKDWIQYYLPAFGRRVYYNVAQDYYWGYRDKEKEPDCGRSRLDYLFDDIERIKEDDDPAYGVDRDPVLRDIAKTVVAKVGQRDRVSYHRKSLRDDDDVAVFTIDGKLTFEAHRDGTFSCPGLPENASLDEVLDAEKWPIRVKIKHWKDEQKKQMADQEFWSVTGKVATRLQEILAGRHNPEWGPDVNTRGFYFGLDTLCSHAKAKAADPLLNLEKAVALCHGIRHGGIQGGTGLATQRHDGHCGSNAGGSHIGQPHNDIEIAA